MTDLSWETPFAAQARGENEAREFPPRLLRPRRERSRAAAVKIELPGDRLCVRLVRVISSHQIELFF